MEVSQLKVVESSLGSELIVFKETELVLIKEIKRHEGEKHASYKMGFEDVKTYVDSKHDINFEWEKIPYLHNLALQDKAQRSC